MVFSPLTTEGILSTKFEIGSSSVVALESISEDATFLGHWVSLCGLPWVSSTLRLYWAFGGSLL